jgi:hypothetical protein
MSIRQDVFGLETVYRLQIEGLWSAKSDVFLDASSLSYQVIGWNYGYWAGGAHSSAVKRLDFSNDTSGFSVRMIVPDGLSPSISYYQNQSVSSPSTAYIFKGSTSSYEVESFDYANDTVNKRPGATQNSLTGAGSQVYNTNYGYFASPGPGIRRFDFSNLTSTSVQSGLSHGGDCGATGNMSYSWWGGGSPTKTTVNRLDYSNDTATVSPRGPLSNGRSSFGGSTGNADYGYFIGGGPGFTSGTTIVDRIDYSNDTATASPKGNLNTEAATSSSNDAAGNSGGAWLHNYFNSNALQKIDYSQDTVTAGNRGSYTNTYWSTSLSIVQYGLPTTTLSASGISPSTYGFSNGYFAGGYNPAPPNYSTIDRIDYSNDTATASVRGPLSVSRRYLSGTGNSYYGYFGGDTSGGNTTIDRVDYSNDTVAASPKSSLTSGRIQDTAAVGTQFFGYFGGGTGLESTVERLDYSNDTATTSPKGPLSVGRSKLAATGNRFYGYFGGGGPGPFSTVDRIDYASDTATASPKGPLSVARQGLAATGNASYGYFGGGDPATSLVDRINYSTDTTTALTKGPLSAARGYSAATGNSSYGYFGGGIPGSLSSVDRIDYSNDTATASPKGPLSVARYQLGASSSHSNSLPIFGTPVQRLFNFANNSLETVNNGYISSSSSNIIRLDFTNDTSSIIGAKMSQAITQGKTGYASSPSYGYWTGGQSLSHVQRLDYAAEDVNLTFRAYLPTIQLNQGSSYNVSYAWFGGGSAPDRSSVVYRLDYSNDMVAPTPKGPLSASMYRHAATGNQNYGYHGGGQGTPSTLSTVDRIDYSNDTATASPKGPLTSARRYLGATGNSSYGYFGGGDPSPFKSTVDRIDFSNDTATGLVKGPLSQTRYQVNATGSSSFGYFFGGQPATTVLDRLDYSNDTGRVITTTDLSGAVENQRGLSARANGAPINGLSSPNITQQLFPNTFFGYFMGGDAPGGSKSNGTKYNFYNDTSILNRGAMSTQRYRLAATSNSSYGYFGGGTPGSISTVDRIDYSNDNEVNVVRGPLSLARNWLAATGNISYGWFGGGSPGPVSTVDRVDYSNDTATASPKGPLSVARSQLYAAGNQSYGWFGGGTPGPFSTVDRIDYSNDTATASPKGPLSLARYNASSVANTDYGYWAGGQPATTLVDRIDFSNDTAAALRKGALVRALDRHAATGNASYGFFSGINPALIDRNSVEKLDYSNDTAGTNTKGQTHRGQDLAGTSSTENGAVPFVFTGTPFLTTNYGYFTSGYLHRLDFSNDTVTARQNISPELTKARSAATGNSNYGYWGGGDPSPWRYVSKLDYNNDTYGVSTNISQLAVSMYYQGGAVGNSNYGYWAGGWNLSGPLAPSFNTSVVSRLDFANDTADAINRANLVVGRSYASGTAGNQSYGYWVGGEAGPRISSVDRIDYSSDTTTSSKGPLSVSQSQNSGAGNSNYGYFSGATPSNAYDTSVQRIDYSNDTATASPKGPLTIGRFGGQATGNNSFGYFVGGSNPGAPAITTAVDRIDYSNDTVTAPSRGALASPGVGYESGNAVSAAENGLPQ